MSNYPKAMTLLLKELETAIDPEIRASLLLEFSKRESQRIREHNKPKKPRKPKKVSVPDVPSTTNWGRKIGG